MGPCHFVKVRSQVANRETASNMESSCEYVNKQSRKADKEWSYSLVFGRSDNNSSPKTGLVKKSGGL